MFLRLRYASASSSEPKNWIRKSFSFFSLSATERLGFSRKKSFSLDSYLEIDSLNLDSLDLSSAKLPALSFPKYLISIRFKYFSFSFWYR